MHQKLKSALPLSPLARVNDACRVSLRNQHMKCGGVVNYCANMGPVSAGPVGPPATPLNLYWDMMHATGNSYIHTLRIVYKMCKCFMITTTYDIP